MLLDRKRVKFWQKIIFSVMALLMVGFGLTGILGAFPGCSSSEETATDQISALKTKLKASPADPETMLDLAQAYQTAAGQTTSESEQTADYVAALKYYDLYLEALGDDTSSATDKKRLEALSSMVAIYASQQDYDGQVRVYSQIIEIQPKNAESYLYYGLAAQNAGKDEIAILAYKKYLELAPNSSDADDVRKVLNDLLGSPSPSPSPSETS